MIENMEPGKYRTRDGGLAIVGIPAGPSLNYWVGHIDNDVHVWNKHGRLCSSSGQKSPLDLVARLPDEPPADDRIERALQALREGLAALQPGDAYLYADYARQAVQILESTP
jgi:hypothetical protein